MSWWEFWKARGEKADFVASFLELAKTSIPGIRAIDQLNFTVLDTETTGLNPAEDFILSFGAVKISQMTIQVSTAVEWYPVSPKNGKATAAIHGLLESKTPVQIADFVPNLLSYLGSSILVGHHLGFDLEMLLKTCKPFGLEDFPNPCIDTMNLAIRLEHGPNADRHQIKSEEYGLDSLCDRYGITKDDRHTAAGDAFLTAQLLLKLLVVAKKKGIKDFASLSKPW
ncbi:MAG: 3'-5' exonuclease [Algoriphagus sp.]|nr:3'-5' exonuclease [Algoriphagus sp.]